MLVIGLSGGLNWASSEQFQEASNFLHDAAAVIVRDGRVIAALEEERPSRLKHCNKFPIDAVRYCLDAAGASASDVDRWAYSFGNVLGVMSMNHFMADMRAEPLLTTPAIVAQRLSDGLGARIAPSAVVSVAHHVAHVASAYEPSGFESALVVSYDGGGDDGHGKVVSVVDGEYRDLAHLGDAQSLGLFYRYTMRPLAYGRFDEYKVMGLAPYGDPARFRQAIGSLYTLGRDGTYQIHFDRFPSQIGLVKVRKPDEEFTQEHKDLAASIQEALEILAFHLIKWAREQTGQRHLCLAGGVALNCTFNGKLAKTNWFDEIFVQPASTDAGAALGAALYVEKGESPSRTRTPMTHVYLGRSSGPDAIAPPLERWAGLLAFEKHSDVCAAAAQKLSEGAVLGWVQGRSEFGPRALGNRSIVADPRPAGNKDRVNLMIKERESYRPFAPSVLAEHASDYFEIPDYPRRFTFMSFAVPVREDKRELLQATTHVDGSSRIQVVFEDLNPRYWRLIAEFHARTGIPVLLNTSFNNNAEPIVDSVDDALQCFMTTGLDGLVIDDYLIEKRRPVRVETWMIVTQLPTTQLIRKTGQRCALRRTAADSREVEVSPDVFWLLAGADARRPLSDALGSSSLTPALSRELFELWQRRLIGVAAP